MIKYGKGFSVTPEELIVGAVDATNQGFPFCDLLFDRIPTSLAVEIIKTSERLADKERPPRAVVTRLPGGGVSLSIVDVTREANNAINLKSQQYLMELDQVSGRGAVPGSKILYTPNPSDQKKIWVDLDLSLSASEGESLVEAARRCLRTGRYLDGTLEPVDRRSGR